MSQAILSELDVRALDVAARHIAACKKRLAESVADLSEARKALIISYCRVLAYHGVKGFEYLRDSRKLDAQDFCKAIKPFMPHDMKCIDIDSGIIVAPSRKFFPAWIPYLEKENLPPRAKKAPESPLAELQRYLTTFAKRSPAHAKLAESVVSFTANLDF